MPKSDLDLDIGSEVDIGYGDGSCTSADIGIEGSRILDTDIGFGI